MTPSLSGKVSRILSVRSTSISDRWVSETSGSKKSKDAPHPRHFSEKWVSAVSAVSDMRIALSFPISVSNSDKDFKRLKHSRVVTSVRIVPVNEYMFVSRLGEHDDVHVTEWHSD